jgi:elongation factor Ts
MSTISASSVKELRDRTGQAMMDCKKALTETSGDIDKAIDLLRKKGMAVMEKRADRQSNEGKVIGKLSDDGQGAALVVLSSETDFTAKNDEFIAVATQAADALLATDQACDSTEQLGELSSAAGGTVADQVNDIVSKTGEKIALASCEKFTLKGPGLLYCYVHFNGKIGTMLQLETESDAAASSDAMQTLAADLAMHITAINPEVVNREQIDADRVAREKDVAVSQVTNKPANIVDKIVEGKMNKWFSQIVLLEQAFVKDDSKSVSDIVAEAGKAAESPITVKRFARVQVG